VVQSPRDEGGFTDYELLKTDDEPRQHAAPTPPVRWRAGAAAVAIAAVGVAAYLAYVSYSGPPRPVTESAIPRVVPPPEEADRPLGGESAALDIPPLDQSDALVRELVKQVSSHPRILAWLATDGLIRNFTGALTNVADGHTPARALQSLRPAPGFRVLERGGDLFVDPRSYERYDALAAAVASIDPAGASRLYATLKPRIDEAYGDLGGGGVPLDRTLERAIVRLLQTPVVDDPGRMRVEPRGIGYGFADPELEGLSGAQKQLLRMGPRNVRIVQASLREIALALGIPEGRLPGPTGESP
jgi:hypothetical protein